MDPRQPRIDYGRLSTEELNRFRHPPSSRALAFARYAYLAILLIGMTWLVLVLRAAGGA